MKSRYISILLIGIVSWLIPSCVREGVDEYVMNGEEEGISTEISLMISLPAMSMTTRSDIPDGRDFELNSLWVGVFNAQTGKCTYAGLSTKLPTGPHGFIRLDGLKTRSGLSYIVAVGNPVDNFGYQYDPLHPDVPLPRMDLYHSDPDKSLLPGSTEIAESRGFTWESYKNIAIRQLALNDVETPVGNLVMSGIFKDTKDDPVSPSEWESLNFTPVRIPAGTGGNSAVTMNGAIHLRRLISQVKFQIKPEDYPGTAPVRPDDPRNGRRIISVIPQGYQVVNVPYTSWLHERRSPDNENIPKDEKTNSGDVVRLNTTSISYGDGEMKLRGNYRRSAMFNGTQYITEHTKTGTDGTSETDYYEFDFWMLENKRRAVAEGLSYDQREKEIKRVAYKDVGAGELEEIDINTGIYTALSGGDGAETMNNCAAFVEIRCRIIYTDEGLSALNPGIDNPEDWNIKYRTADAIYTIHLGGIESDWSDFTHRRNHKYTYIVTVVDVDRIVVEAKREEEELRPGIEGIVTDVINPPFEMDAHYGIVNIQLSNWERTGGENGDLYGRNKFPFRIRVYDGDGNAIFLDQDNFNDPGIPEYYWNWVELRPTTDATTLAEYKPYGKAGEVPGADGKTIRLKDLANVRDYPGTLRNGETFENSVNEDDQNQRWYTVFVNEYVYEESNDETSNNWTDYVNLPPRMCWLNTVVFSSKDEESNYIISKYAIRQRSIQTFYDIPDNMDKTNADINALGLEHINETLGFNLRWYEDDVPLTKFKFSSTNGRRNQILHIRNNKWGTNWANYYNATKIQTIDGINTNSVQFDRTDDLQFGADQPYYVPAIVTLTADVRGQAASGNMNGNIWRHNINNNYYLVIMNSCMNRNRDNNGNGVIDRDEIRWYLPSSSEMVDMVLGRNSLETPLMDFARNPYLNSPQVNQTDSPHHANTRFHYATSNKRVLWAEEGSTINAENDFFNTSWNGAPWNIPPQQVRCARALGTHLESDSEDAISPAFEVDNPDAPTKIYPTFYESKNRRSYSPTPISAHQETSTQNRICSDGFEFKKEVIQRNDYTASFENFNDKNNQTWSEWYSFYWRYDANVIKDVSRHDEAINNANQICLQTYGSGWRVPTMKEAALIKIALNNVFNLKRTYPTDLWHRSTVLGYDIDNFLTCTYREYGMNTESRTDKTGIYTGVLYWHPGRNHEVDTDDDGNIIGRVACITNTDFLFNIRCVRDLQAVEE